MTNNLLGEVYLKIIEEVAVSSTGDFEENGVNQTVLQALQQEWQAKLSQRNVAHMPWDPKPVQQSPAPPSVTQSGNAAANGVPSSAYTSYTAQASSAATTNGSRVKAESSADAQYAAASNGYTPNAGQPQGGIARAQQLVQAQYGQAASASLNAMQRGLALPGQQQSPPKPQGLQLPQSVQNAQQQFAIQQQQAMQRGQQHIQQQQQSQPQIKAEASSPDVRQGAFQQSALPNYSQTDGADDVLEQWKHRLAETRAAHQAHGRQADHLMRQHVMQAGADLRSGLMVPLDEQPSIRNRNRRAVESAFLQPTDTEEDVQTGPSIPQLDGEVDDDDKSEVRDEDDENAINSDLDDSDSDGRGMTGEDDEDFGDEILCTYDKVQRVKNKWKCTLKDGVMSANGKDWVFHKGMGEFEW